MAFIYVLTLIASILCTFPWPTLSSNKPTLQTYIVHVEGPQSENLMSQPQDLESWYESFLPLHPTSADRTVESRIIYSYRNALKGFAARLSTDDLKEMEKKEGFIAAVPDKKLSLDTTYSPKFLGLNKNTGLWNDSGYGKGVIIGVMDTGVSPDHPSFSDEGMPPPPPRWKGKCQFNNTKCNNKIIGARYFSIDDQSPLDDYGHGTHTASTAAGNFVEGANALGNAYGTASGIAPRAHLAIYKVCCESSTLLAGMDAAIEDGVDIISVSLSSPAETLYEDYVSLAGFSAVETGISVISSAGNDGPYNYTVGKGAPWVLTVGASTTDRKIRATVLLGNNQSIYGESGYQPKRYSTKLLPLVHAGMLNSSDEWAMFCYPGSLNKTAVKGKVVVCEGAPRVEKGETVKDAGGAAMILINSQRYANTIEAQPHVLPATVVTYADGIKIKAYLNSTVGPKATIRFDGTLFGDDRAPVVAAFSSRGPNIVSPGILKPDILGPGVNILAAWPSYIENENGIRTKFQIDSGTSMSCPHLSGVAALLKSVHPDWSPAAIKSAIMTTADTVNLAHHPIEDEQYVPASVFATGAGQVNPSRAKDPGLIYDIRTEDYIPYLCGLNYTDREVGFFLQRRVKCSNESKIPEAQLNYPSFSIILTRGSTSSQTYTRTVTNVGNRDSVYSVEISAPPGVDVSVKPSKLSFSKLNQKMQYEATFSPRATGLTGSAVQGYLKWNSAKHSVRSPIAVILG